MSMTTLPSGRPLEKWENNRYASIPIPEPERGSMWAP